MDLFVKPEDIACRRIQDIFIVFFVQAPEICIQPAEYALIACFHCRPDTYRYSIVEPGGGNIGFLIIACPLQERITNGFYIFGERLRIDICIFFFIAISVADSRAEKLSCIFKFSAIV